MPNYRTHFYPDALLLHPKYEGDGSIALFVRFVGLGSPTYEVAVSAPQKQQKISIADGQLIKALLGKAKYAALPSVSSSISFQDPKKQWSELKTENVSAKLLTTSIDISETASAAKLDGERQETVPIEIRLQVIEHKLIPFSYVHLSREYLTHPDRFALPDGSMTLVARSEGLLCGAKVPI